MHVTNAYQLLILVNDVELAFLLVAICVARRSTCVCSVFRFSALLLSLLRVSLSYMAYIFDKA